jgi:hypothetical protein
MIRIQNINHVYKTKKKLLITNLVPKFAHYKKSLKSQIIKKKKKGLLEEVTESFPRA